MVGCLSDSEASSDMEVFGFLLRGFLGTTGSGMLMSWISDMPLSDRKTPSTKNCFGSTGSRKKDNQHHDPILLHQSFILKRSFKNKTDSLA